ncbi:MAG: hypothetical protein HZB14_01260 [Actinobacteria bacterium]|nr:hypothetical protein [Actinomycetota bacterium]
MRKRIDPWLFAVFVGCSLFAAVLVYRAREWSVMTDELLYTEMARGMLSSGLPLPSARGEYVQVYQVLYPLLIAPVIWIVGMPEAYQAIAVVNAVAITSACVPAYMLTTYVTGDRVLARWVGLCVGVLPWIALATKILTDSLAYPLFLWALYAIVRAVAEAEGTRRRDLIALGAIAAAYLARSQFVVLPAIFCVAILARAFAVGAAAGARAGGSHSNGGNHSAGSRWAAVRSASVGGLRETLRAPLRRKLVFGVTLVVVTLVAAKPSWILGIYAATTGDEFGSVVPGNLLGQMSSHLGMIALGIGVVPLLLALPWIVVASGRAGDARQNATALTFAVSALVLLFVVASFDVRFSHSDEEIYERYIFYLAPLMLVGSAALFKHPPRNWLGFVLPALAGLLIFARDDHFGLDDPVTISLNQAFKPVAIFRIALQRAVDAISFLPSVTTAMALFATAAAGAVWMAIVRGHAGRAGQATFAIIALYCAWATVFTVPKTVDSQNHAGYERFGLRTADQKTWIDRAAGERDVSLIYNSINFADGRPVDTLGRERTAFWDAELWNASIRSYYTPFEDRGAVKATMAPYHRLRVSFADGSIRLSGGEAAPFWLMSGSDPRFAPLPSGAASRDHFTGLALYPVPPEPRADWATHGLTYYGFVPAGGPAVLRVYADRAETGSRPAKVQIQFERKGRDSGAGQLDPKQIREPSTTRSFTKTVCLSPEGHADIDVAALARPLIDGRHVARLVSVRVARDTAGSC